MTQCFQPAEHVRECIEWPWPQISSLGPESKKFMSV